MSRKFIGIIWNGNLLLTEQMESNHNGTVEPEEPMDIEAGQFEDAEEDP